MMLPSWKRTTTLFNGCGDAHCTVYSVTSRVCCCSFRVAKQFPPPS